jgi:hypothetical protein
MRAFVDKLHSEGRRWVPIHDSAVAKVPGYPVFDEGTLANVWIKEASGGPYVGQVGCKRGGGGVSFSHGLKEGCDLASRAFGMVAVGPCGERMVLATQFLMRALLPMSGSRKPAAGPIWDRWLLGTILPESAESANTRVWMPMSETFLIPCAGPASVRHRNILRASV